MNVKQGKTALAALILLAGMSGLAHADVAATVDPAAISGPTYPLASGNHSLGWRFFVDQQITITHLGVYDHGDNGLAGPQTLGIWRVNKTGGLTLLRQVEIGSGGVTEDHHVYVDIEDLTIVPDPEPWVDPDTGLVYYERWLVGAWSPSGSTDGFIIRPRSAGTLAIAQAGIIRLENYTWKTSSTFAAPWGNTSAYDYHGVNFKYELPTPVAEAGPDVTIYSCEQGLDSTGEPLTTILGTATDPFPGPDPLTYRWLVDGVVLQDWLDVGAEGEANLSLAAPAPLFAVGVHTLTLEVTDGAFTVSDTMTLTVENTPPDVQPAPTSQVVEINVDPIIIAAEVADFDGDEVSYQWLKDGEVLASGTVDPPAGGGIECIPDLAIAPGDPRFPLGVNSLELVVSDGVNPPVSVSVTVEVKDTTAPTLAPTPSATLLWPPNRTLRPVTVWANAEDNGGGLITLAATVVSSEPEDGGGDGSTGPDCYVDSIDQVAGTIYLMLRAERSGTGDGRVYTISVTATDSSMNQSSATVEVRVPHDRRKK